MSTCIPAIQHDSELRLYYKRKLAERKDKILAINNVRNKLIAVSNKLIKQSFAIAKSGHPYDETFVSVLPK